MTQEQEWKVFDFPEDQQAWALGNLILVIREAAAATSLAEYILAARQPQPVTERPVRKLVPRGQERRIQQPPSERPCPHCGKVL